MGSVFKYRGRIVMYSVLFLFLASAIVIAKRPQGGNPPTPRIPQGSTGEVEYKSFPSPKLGKNISYAVQLPPSYATSKKRYPVVIFLHGLFEHENTWEGHGAVAVMDKLRTEGKIGEMILVVPYGETSFYTDSADGKAPWEQAITFDLVDHLDKTYRTIGTAKGRIIGGISMGGFGALKMAFRHPDQFAAVIAHCPALATADLSPDTDEGHRYARYSPFLAPIFGNPIDMNRFHDNDPITLAVRNAKQIQQSGLKVYFDCGTEDRFHFFDGAQVLDKTLTDAKIPHEFHLFPGNHGWVYATGVMDHSLPFAWQSVKSQVKG